MTSSLLTRVAPALLLSATLTAGFAVPGFAQSGTGTAAPNTSAQATPSGTESGAGAAQATTPGTATAEGATQAEPGNGTAMPSLQQLAEQRLQDLHQRLNITEKEQPKWEKFAKTMRNNAESLDKAYQQRAQKIGQMTAVENMRSYAHIERMRANDMQNLVGPFQSLYASLSPQQQQEANDLFRQRAQAAAQRHGNAADSAAQTTH